MKDNPKDQEHLYTSWTFSKLVAFLLLLISLSYIVYSLRYVNHTYPCKTDTLINSAHSDTSDLYSTGLTSDSQSGVSLISSHEKTNLSHMVFGIAASAKLWNQRKEYIKLWWRPNEMRGVVWLDKVVESEPEDEIALPPLVISGDTSKFKYKNSKGHRSAIRISRIVSETLRLGMEDVRWFVMGDDDTIFVPENLMKVLQKYDHNLYYYIWSSSESHLQNLYNSYDTPYEGAGFAIMHACMVELGVPLTRERGFHQVSL